MILMVTPPMALEMTLLAMLMVAFNSCDANDDDDSTDDKKQGPTLEAWLAAGWGQYIGRGAPEGGGGF